MMQLMQQKRIPRLREHNIREWCEEKLITSAGTRSLVYQDVKNTGGMSNKVVDVLQNKYLIRAEERAGSKWFELTHDRLINPIKDSNKKHEETKKMKIFVSYSRRDAVILLIKSKDIFLVLNMIFSLMLIVLEQETFGVIHRRKYF